MARNRMIAASLLALCAACSSGDDDASDVPRANRAPAFTGSAEVSARENAKDTGLTLTAEDPDGEEVAFAITGGADADAFVLDGDRLLFAERPDFEAPGDRDGDNAYEVRIQVSDGTDAAQRDFVVTLTDGVDGRLVEEGTLRVDAAPKQLGDLDGDGYAEVGFDTPDGFVVAQGVAVAVFEGELLRPVSLPLGQDGVLIRADQRYDFVLGQDIGGAAGDDILAYDTFQSPDTDEDEARTQFAVLLDADFLNRADAVGVFDFDAAIDAAAPDAAFTFRTTDRFDEAVSRTVFAAPLNVGDERSVIGFGQERRGYLFGAADLPALAAASPFARPPEGVGTEIGTVDADGASFGPVGDVDADGMTDFAFANADEVVVVFGDDLPSGGTVRLDALRVTRIAPRTGFGVLAVTSGELGAGEGRDLFLPREDLAILSGRLTSARGGTLDPASVPGSGGGYRLSSALSGDDVASSVSTARLIGRDGTKDPIITSDRADTGAASGDVVRLALILDGASSAADADGIVDLEDALRTGDAVAVEGRVPDGIRAVQSLTKTVSVLGDVDGDGVMDLGISARYEEPTPINGAPRQASVSYLVSGRLVAEAAVDGEAISLD